VAVHKTAIMIDDELVMAARRVLGTSTMTATVDAALRSVIAGEARQQWLDMVRDLGPELGEVRGRAWRSAAG
jgi:Arc/MetJ family transcription regulator